MSTRRADGMERKLFKRLAPMKEAEEILYRKVKPRPVGVEEVDITQALGRVLGEDITAGIDLPPFSRALVDGYAVRSVDTSFASETKPVQLRVVGTLFAGETSSFIIKRGECVGVDTGAVVPKGSDAIVRVEDTTTQKGTVFIKNSVGRGEGMASRASDVYSGQLVMARGEEITTTGVGILAGLGYRKVKVLSRPCVAILSIGNELIAPGEYLGPSQIYDVNQYTIGALVEEAGCQPVYMDFTRDRLEDVRKAIIEGLGRADALIMSGGTSAGISDVAYRAFEGLEGPGLFLHGIATKPGKPVVMAAIGKKPVFGLPGFPVSALIVYHSLIDPLLRAMSGKKLQTLRRVRAKLARRHLSVRGRREQLPVFLRRLKGQILAMPISKDSGAIGSLSLADGTVEIPENVELIEEGEPVTVKAFPRARVADVIITGDPSPITDLMLAEVRKKGAMVKGELRGLEHGLTWMRDGAADMLTTCTAEAVHERLRSVAGRLDELRGFTMEMVWASSADVAFRPGLTVGLQPLGSGLRRKAEEFLRKEVRAFSVAEAFSYATLMKFVKDGRADMVLVPLCFALEHDVKYVRAFSAHVGYFSRKVFLHTRVGKRLLRIMRGRELTEQLGSTPGVSL